MPASLRFGKYLLHERLASGWVADIWRATTQTAAGQQLPVVVKAIRPELAGQADLVSRFAEEARLSSLLNHPNIATVYEWGREGEQLFIAMEYIEGTNLAALLQAVVEQGIRFPPTIGIYITQEALAGLDYAHGLRDPFGNLSGLVHRDPSPPNLVVSSDGKVKLVDFGLARVTARATQTRPELLAGREGYLAPEVRQSAAVDARADLYTLGMALYEVLAGRSLHDRIKRSEPSSAQQLASRQPPSSVYPDIPEELDWLVLRALSQDPAGRPASAAAMRGELANFLQRWDRQVDADSLSSFILEVMSGRAGEKKEKVGFAFGEATSQWMSRGENLEELVPLAPREEQPPPPAEAPIFPEGMAEPPPETESEFSPPRQRFSSGETMMAIREGGLGTRRHVRNILVALLALGIIGVGIFLLLRFAKSQDESIQLPKEEENKLAGVVTLKLDPPDAVVFVDGQAITPLADPARIEGLGAGTHQVRVAAPGYLPWETQLDLAPGAPGEILASLQARRGELFLLSQPKGALVLRDGRKLGKTPLHLKEVEVAKSYHFLLKAPRFQPQEVVVAPTDWPEDIAAPLKITRKLVRPGKRGR